ncbi:MAG: GNAT family N-acetyltransferase [Simkania sp.]|nr:GNAT family N-acetyltransferase [Simkania sp.]
MSFEITGNLDKSAAYSYEITMNPSSLTVEEVPTSVGSTLIKEWSQRVGIGTKSSMHGEISRIAGYRQVLVHATMEVAVKPKYERVIYIASTEVGIQGFLIGNIVKNTLMVAVLATAPANFLPELYGQDAPPIKGVGSALIEHAKIQAGARGLDSITLRYFEEAKGFYKRLGMIQTEQGFRLSIPKTAFA